MLLLLFLVAVPLLEVFVFVEVALAIGWLLALFLLIATSVLGTRLLRSQGRTAIGRVTAALSEGRPPGRPAVLGLLGLLGSALLAIPGFLTDVVGLLLLLPFTRALAASWMVAHYSGRLMGFATSSGRFASQATARRPADVDSTAVDLDQDQLED